MLIEALLNLVLALLRALLFNPENAIREVPQKFAVVVSTAAAYIIDGIRIVNCYIDEVYISALLAFVLALDAFILLYRVIMWILRKIPFLGID